MHAHAGKKGCFFYGNAIDDFISHVKYIIFLKFSTLHPEICSSGLNNEDMQKNF